MDDNDQDERGGMVLVAWLLLLMWALFGLLIAWLCSGDGEGVARWIGMFQAYFCYVWISVALAAVLMLAIGDEQR
ncbi:hypothetical protein KSF_095750 [Reticulibacter mediterranei]|uniref:Uncharacterized protein n=1 Tax=Reticulibacter mediterranei TaxID=2778369 RepID=A0A8J3N9P0_9CHLR|nr:hypothetical protein [Reticulibacter mediterranei]GHO99527.1 hypothetical protein KSF_095750 [Reticulibacter mediterranei]